jgi:hypothetical protein
MKPSCKYCGKECKLAPSQKEGRRKPRQYCNSCCVTKRRWKSKIEMVMGLGGKCKRCGFTGHPGAFHFHHTDPSNKSHELNGNKLLTKDRWNELAKCELLCANCHHAEHSNTELMKKMNLMIDTAQLTS